MSKNSRLLRCGYDIEVFINGIGRDDPADLIRVSEGELFELKLKLYTEKRIEKVHLHTDMYSDHWEMLPFEKTAENEYRLQLEAERGGKSCFRFAVETDDSLLWEPDDYHTILIDPAVMESLRMYTLIPNITGSLANWKKKLPEISEMGFNALHILPFTEMCMSESPYAADDLFKIDRSYDADIDDFRDFAESAKRLGIIICLDIVLNHLGFTNRICREHGDWIVPDPDRDDGMKRAGCYHMDSWISWEDLVLINYNHPDLSVRYKIYDYMLEYVLFWIDAAGGDNVMIRLDNLHSSNEHFIKWLIPMIRKKYPGIIVLSEFFGADYHINEAVMNYGLNLITANSWEYPFAPDLQRYLSAMHNQNDKIKYFLSPVSHDTEPAAMLFGKAESSIPRYAACALMGTGMTGTVQGYEDGVAAKINFIGRNPEPQPTSEHDFRKFLSNTNRLLSKEKCLRMRGNIEFYDTGNDSLIICRRRDPGHGSILIAINLDIYNSHTFDYPVIGNSDLLLAERAEMRRENYEERLHIVLEACGVCAVRTGI